MELNEVAPPGWGHTKAEKEKTKPNKPKSKIGGSAAAFKRALDDGRFKGLPGDKTKKEKTASMFKLMWSMKKKGDKPHYKPGTDKKYKKYEEDWKPEIEHVKGSDLRKKAAEKKRKEAESSLPPHLRLDVMKKAFKHTNESAVLDANTSTERRDKLKKELARLKARAAAMKKYGSSYHPYLHDKQNEETSMAHVSKKDKGAIKKRFAGLFKKDVKGTVQGVNEGDLHDNMDTFKTNAVKRRDKNSLGTIASATKRYEALKKIIGSKKKPTKPAIKEGVSYMDFLTRVKR